MKWINIKDKLPENETGVLICGKSTVGSFYDLALFNEGEFIVDIDNPKRVKKITHWMQLPDPPTD